MKKLLLLLLFIPLVSFGQNNNSTNSTNIKIESNNMFVDAANRLAEGEGIFYKGKGIYTIQQTGKTTMASYRRQVKKPLRMILINDFFAFFINYDLFLSVKLI